MSTIPAGELTLARTLAVDSGEGQRLLPSTTRILLAPTDDDAVVHVLTVADQRPAGTALLEDVLDRANRGPRPAPVSRYRERLHSIAGAADAYRGWRGPLEALVRDVRRAGHADLAADLERAAGRKGTQDARGAGDRLRRLLYRL